VTAVQEFLEICKKHLQNSEPSLRPKLAVLLDHTFFTHKFIKIHSFLVELPLKTEAEKGDFFRSVHCKIESVSSLPCLCASELDGFSLPEMK
jgi:hypothetical protein